MDDNIKRQQEILSLYTQSVKNFKEALREANMSASLILYHTMNFPDLDLILPEDVAKLYKEIKVLVILRLAKIGFSSREIARRLGGHTDVSVRKILGEYRSNKVISSKSQDAKDSREITPSDPAQDPV